MSSILGSTWVLAIIKICATALISFIFTHVIEKAFDKNILTNAIHMKFLKNLIIALIWIIGICSVASEFNTFSRLANTILAGSGIMAVIIGLAAQESFSNLFSGLFISIFKPFNIGDRIRIVGDDTAGYVEDITLRHTVIRTYMNVRIIIPNSIIGSAKIENSTYSVGASYPIDITIAYENAAKRRRALDIMEEVVTSHPKFYDSRTDEDKQEGDKPVHALCTRCGESGIDLRVLMWTESVIDNPRACSECRLEILDRFEAEDIEVTYNKLVVITKDNSK